MTLLMVVTQVLHAALFPVLAYQRAAILDGQLWRLWSAHFIHLGTWHLLLNLGALWLFALICPVRWSRVGWLLRLGVLAAGTSLGLLWWMPSLQWFVGLSGLLHGLFVLGLWAQVRQRDRLALAALVLLAGKLAWEGLAGGSVTDQALIGGRVITQSHAFGAASAVIFLSACEGLTRLRAAVNVSAPDTSNDD